MKKNKSNSCSIRSVENITVLPDEILLYCFSFLKSAKDLVALSKTNHRLRKLALDDSLWQIYYRLQMPKIEKFPTIKKRKYPCNTIFAELTSGILAVSYSYKIHFVDTVHFKRLNIKIVPDYKINTLSVLPNNRLAIGSSNGTIEIWRLKFNTLKTKQHKFWRQPNTTNVNIYREKVIQVSRCHRTIWCRGIRSLVVLPDDTLASGGCCEGKIYIWNTNNSKNIQTLKKHTQQVTAIAVLSNGNLASGCAGMIHKNDPIRIWDLKTGQCIKKLNPLLSTVTHTHTTPNILGDTRAINALPNNYLAVARTNKHIRIWDANKGKLITILPAEASRLAVLPHGELVSWYYTDRNIIRIWDTRNRIRIQKHQLGAKNVYNTNFGDLFVLNDGRLIFGRAGDGIYVFNFPRLPENRLKQNLLENEKKSGSNVCKIM